MNKTKFLAGVLILVLFAISTDAQVKNKRIKFPKGETSATVENSVIRGDEDTYLVGAGKDQYMIITIMSLEDNAVFQIVSKKTGDYLPGAEEGTDIRRWEGYLPSTGDYKIIVGGTRGNCEYTMKVSIE